MDNLEKTTISVDIKSLSDSQYLEPMLMSLNINESASSKDTLSQLFEKIQDKTVRKKFGQFFTPIELTNFILDNIPVTKNSKILDPACGAGTFLVSALERNGGNTQNIYGFDIDDLALNLCRLNLKRHTKIENFNLVKINTLNDFSQDLFFPEINLQGGFDIIIGNPPFKVLKKGIDYKSDNDLYNQVLDGNVNSATLFVIKSYLLLKEDGYLGFVLPKTMLRVKSFAKLRQFLLTNTRLLMIYDLDHYFKDVRGDQIIIILQKKKLNKQEEQKNKVKIKIFKKGSSFKSPYEYMISQSDFRKFSIFPIFYDERVLHLALKLLAVNNTLELMSNGEIFRGIGINPNHKSVVTEQESRTFTLYKGKSIGRFVTRSKKRFIDISKLEKEHQNKVKRLQATKIIIQNIMSREGGITAALSDASELDLDTVTNVHIKDERYLKYILGLLNSHISNFFMIFIVFLHSNFTMHLDKEYVGKLPIIIPSKTDMESVSNSVDKLIKIGDSYSIEFFDEYNKLNDKLFDIYKFNNKERQLIETCLKSIMSVRHYGRSNE